ncbi:MAG: methyltransferase domain-containing protein [Pseudomonadota bacterium]
MRKDVFEALAPVCPRNLHGAGKESPLKLASVMEERDGHVWHGMLHSTDESLWTEYPIIDGVPILVPDVPTFLNNTRSQIQARQDLSADTQSLLGDAFGPGSEFDATRQHLSIYAYAHFSDWLTGAAGDPSQVAGLSKAISDAMDLGGGAALDLGCSVGRATWEMARHATGPVLGGDLNFSMLQLAQRLMVEGSATFDLRRIGIVYDPVVIDLPDTAAADKIDFWAMDCMALPFPKDRFEQAVALNLVDCIAVPTQMLVEVERTLVPGGRAAFTTPYDWAGNATEPSDWLGGHSQRAPHKGAGEPVLTATLAQAGLTPVAENASLPWKLRLHARSVMHYDVHMVACQKAA